MTPKRKSPQPVTLLTKIEGLLADVLRELSSVEESVEKNVRELLVSAAASVAAAKDFITPVFAAAAAAAPKRATSRRRPGRRSKRARSRR
jgi:hypothetical protein